ncbi:hypothetical protein STRIP9103_00488 [Streptomyces ipomoeae 91-03]|uniref:Uncharacterized protein n=1 Tax=Streptomyces ipomoeae 91-03 TaxID=698759 RepID=L1L2Z4_9ACTN|nr:hypothetical protein STRIP9103_00488 [Streptomyces ipomoeae 91-03]
MGGGGTGRSGHRVRTPRTSDPAMFTVKVPQGKTVSWRDCTARSVR